MLKKIHIISGGTMEYIRPHLALCAPGFGNTGRLLRELCDDQSFKSNLEVHLHETKMASDDNFISDLVSNKDVQSLLDKLVSDFSTKIIMMPVSLCDFQPELLKFDIDDLSFRALPTGKEHARLQTKNGPVYLKLTPAEKIIRSIRKNRKDIFLVGFKQTSGESEQNQYLQGLDLLKKASCNLVLANDVKTKVNMIITPEEAAYHITTNRLQAMYELVEMTLLRSHLTFTRSTVIAGESIPWNSELIPESLRTIVNYCISRGAYKVFNGSTVGHFACKINDTTFLTSKRKTNFNDLEKIGLVKIETDGPDAVIAYGSKPSVGRQSQRLIFEKFKDLDCIVHAHIPIKPESKVNIISQREFECGSHQCGENTANGLRRVDGLFEDLYVVMLDNHGPNIVFNHNINPKTVIDFIEENFDLDGKTGGYLL